MSEAKQADQAASGKQWPPNSSHQTVSSCKTNFSNCASTSSSLSGRSLWSLHHHQQQQQQQHQILIAATVASAQQQQQAATSQLGSPTAANKACKVRLLNGVAEPLVSSKFHRAAIDGYVDMLCEASKRETNAPAKEHHMLTPTLLAAQSGQLEALRILVGRGGDPECVSSTGCSALHLASARNHLNCVSFLVNFGVNMWALDNELRTAKDLAAIEQNQEILDYLDQVMAKHSAINTKQVQKLKERAKLAAEKRLKQVRKAQLKAIKQIERDERQLAKLSHQRRLLRAAHSISDIKLVGRSSLDLLGPLDATCATGGEATKRTAYFRGASQQATSNETSSSNRLANYFRHRLQADHLLVGTRGLHRSLAHEKAGARKESNPMAMATAMARKNCSDQESFSSVSSTSGYLSSCSAKSVLKTNAGNNQAGATNARPRYSDLVALNNPSREPSGHNGDAASSIDGASAGDRAQQVAAGVSSGSTFALRLRAISGVSRKVHPRRLLGGAANLSAAAATSNKASDRRAEANLCESAAITSGILKRAKSEPDFASAGAAESSDHDCSSASSSLDGSDDAGESDDELERQASNASKKSVPSEQSDHRINRPPHKVTALSANPAAVTALPPPPPPPPLPPLANATTEAQSESKHSKCDEQQTSKQQQHLLTQCLSQLKLQQEVMSQRQQQLASLSESDELLRHQLNAGDSPLRPSIIKYQQKHLASGARDLRCDNSSSVKSADSIGSAGSIIQLSKQSSSCASSTTLSSCELVGTDAHQPSAANGVLDDAPQNEST